MVTINNIDDLMRLLDEHPQWLDAVRARVLTPELVELTRFTDKPSQPAVTGPCRDRRIDESVESGEVS